LNGRFVVLGLLFVVVGVLFILYPNVLLSPTHVSDRTDLVRIAPGNYSALHQAVGPTQSLSVTLTSSPQPVDFFLMNSSNFASWTAKGNPPTDIYPQYSKLGATSFSFQVPGAGSPANYTLVFLSTSLSAPNTVEAQLVVDNQVGFFQANLVPIIVLICGIALVALGATRKGKVEEKPPEEEVKEASQGSGLMGLFGGGSSQQPGRTCRYCGASVEEGAAFCPSCHRSQP